MDFLDPKKKKAHKVQLYIGYALMSIVILLAGVILLYAAFGYGIDRQGNVVQNGIVFIASTPDAAEVLYTNKETNQENKAVTDDRLTLPAGEYALEFLKEGYRPWQHDLLVHGGDIERLTYPFLFPQELTTADVNLYSSTPQFSTASPDRGKIVVLRPGNDAVFDVFQTSDPTRAPETFTLPADIYTPSDSAKLELVEWSTNNRHMLVKHSMGNTTEFIVVDTEQPTESQQINEALGINPKAVSLFDKKPDELYVLTSSNRLLRASLQDTNTEVVLDNVVAYKSHGRDRLLYVTTKDAAANNVSLIISDGKESYKIRELPKSPSYVVDMAQHEGHWFIVAGSTNGEEAYVYRDPFETLRDNDERRILLTRTLDIEQPKHVSFSENTQFVALQNKNKFAIYDVFEDREFYYEFETPFDAGAKPAKWMDGHRLTSVSKKKVVVFDFDGSNYQTLSPATSGSQAMFDRDYTRLLTIGTSVDVKNRAALTDTALRVE